MQNNQPTDTDNDDVGSLPGLGSSSEPDYATDIPENQPTGSSFWLHAEGAVQQGVHAAQGLILSTEQPEYKADPSFQKEEADWRKDDAANKIAEKEARIPSGGRVDSAINWTAEQLPLFGASVLTEGIGGLLTKGASAAAKVATSIPESAIIGAGYNIGGDAVHYATTNVSGESNVPIKTVAEDALLGGLVGGIGHVAVNIVGNAYHQIRGRFKDKNTIGTPTTASQQKIVQANGERILNGQNVSDTAQIEGGITANTVVNNFEEAKAAQPLDDASRIAENDIAEAHTAADNQTEKASTLAKEIPTSVKDYSDGEVAALNNVLDEYITDDDKYDASLKSLKENVDNRTSEWSPEQKEAAKNLFDEDKLYDSAKLHETGNPTHESPYRDERKISSEAQKAIAKAPAKAFTQGRNEPTTREAAAKALDQNDTWDHKINSDWIQTIPNKSKNLKDLSEKMKAAVEAKKALPKYMGDYLSQSKHPSLKALEKFVEQAKEARNLRDAADAKQSYLDTANNAPFDVQGAMRSQIENDADGTNNIETPSKKTITEVSKEFGTGSPEEEVLTKKLEEMKESGNLSPEQEEELKQQRINELMGRGDEGFVKAAVACMTGQAIAEPTITYAEKLEEIQEGE